MRHSACGGLYVTGAVWMDGQTVDTVTVGLFSDGRSSIWPTVSPLTLRVKGVKGAVC